MTIVDRYLLRLFIKIFLVCFLSFTGLFVVIHLFSNLDELMTAAETNGGIGQMLLEFYSPRALDILDRTSGILLLISAIFSVSMMHRRRELTAVQAAGISKMRVVRPILVASVILVLLSVANRELILPQFKDQLVRAPETWGDAGSVPMHMKRDVASGLVFRGDDLMLGEKKITNAEVQIPANLSRNVDSIQAESGIVKKAYGGQTGLHLFGVSYPSNLNEVSTITSDTGEPVILFPRDNEWLAPQQCFVVADLDVQELAFGQQLDQYKPVAQLMTDLRQPRSWLGNQKKIQVHSRILRPVLDLTLLLLGLPLVIGRPDQNIFAAAGFCMIVVIAVQLSTKHC